MLWPLNGPETISALIGLSGIVWPSVWTSVRTRREAAAKAAADRAVTAQADAMANKDKEITGWKEQYEQERREHREDTQRLQDHIDRLVESRSARRDRR